MLDEGTPVIYCEEDFFSFVVRSRILDNFDLTVHPIILQIAVGKFIWGVGARGETDVIYV